MLLPKGLGGLRTWVPWGRKRLGIRRHYWQVKGWSGDHFEKVKRCCESLNKTIMQAKWKNTVQASSLKLQNLRLIFHGHAKCSQKNWAIYWGQVGWEWFVKMEGGLQLLSLQQPLKSIHCLITATSLLISPWQPLIWKTVLAWTLLLQLMWQLPLQWSFPLFAEMSEEGPTWALWYFPLSWEDKCPLNAPWC